MSFSAVSSSCFIRKRSCILTPEEMVRQRLLEILCLEKGFPRGLCSVEVAIQSLKNVMLNSCEQGRSKRRIDILFSRAQESALFPFFLIECKAFNSKRLGKNDFIDAAALRQVMGYRNRLGAIPYVAIASHDQIAIWSFLSGTKSSLNAPWYYGTVQNMPMWSELGS